MSCFRMCTAFGRTSPVMRSGSHDSVFDDPDLTPDPVTSQTFEETPFSPPASIAQHLQSLKPGLDECQCATGSQHRRQKTGQTAENTSKRAAASRGRGGV